MKPSPSLSFSVLFPKSTAVYVCDCGHEGGGEQCSFPHRGKTSPWPLALSWTPPAPVSGLAGRKISGAGKVSPPRSAAGAERPTHQAPPSSRRTRPLAVPVPHYLLAHRRGRHLGEFWLSPDAPTTPIRQKARFKIRDAKCHLRPRSQERAKDTLRHPLLGKWTIFPLLIGEQR